MLVPLSFSLRKWLQEKKKGANKYRNKELSLEIWHFRGMVWRLQLKSCPFLAEISLRAELSIIIAHHKKYTKMLFQLLLNKIWNYIASEVHTQFQYLKFNCYHWFNTAGSSFLDNVALTVYTFTEYILACLSKCL